MASVDLDSIRDLLLSDCSEDKLKALSEIEKSSDLQVADVFADEILVELVCLNGPGAVAVLVEAGRMAMTCERTWSRFQNAMIEPGFLTCQKIETMIVTNDINRQRVYTKTFTLQKLALGNYTYASCAAIAKLVQNAGNELIDLSGLQFISVRSAEALNMSQANIRLHGITELSSETARVLAMHSRGDLSLMGLESASDEVLLQLSGQPNLKIPSLLRKRMKKLATDSRAKVEQGRRTGVRNLSKSQGTSIRKLLRTKDPTNVALAIELAHASAATNDDVLDIFTLSLISLLVDTWDVQVWNSLAPAFALNEHVRLDFFQLARTRIHNSDHEFFNLLQSELTEFAYPFFASEFCVFDGWEEPVTAPGKQSP